MRWCPVVVAVMVVLHAVAAQAQQDSKGGLDPAQRLYMQADQLTYDTRGNRVIAQGSVEIYYDNYILTADQVTYDQTTNRLIAEGNAQLKDPAGNVTRADRFEAFDDFRDAFAQWLKLTSPDDTHIIIGPSR